MDLVESYNAIDLFCAAAVLVGFVLGIWKGFIRSLTALASVVLGVFLAANYHHLVSPYLAKISRLDPQISMILSMIVVFVLVQAAFVVVRRFLDKLLDLTRLTWLDRILGAAMGSAAGLLVVASLVQVILMGIPDWPKVKASRLVVPVDRLTEKAMAQAPQGVRDHWQSLVSKWKGMQEPAAQAPARDRGPSKTATAPPAGSVR